MNILTNRPPQCLLATEDGRVFEGKAYGLAGKTTGELVFNTGMTGYQEILTDPSYAGQIVVMTAPLIGNYGTNEHDTESEKPMVSGFVMREGSRVASNWMSDKTLKQYLVDNNVMAADGFDTRAVTLHIRDRGAMRSAMGVGISADDLVDMARAAPSMAGLDLARGVMCKKAYEWESKNGKDVSGPLVVVLDYGVKRSILRQLSGAGARVTVVPGDTPASDVLGMKPSGVLVSNGPGDPEPLKYAVETVRGILGKIPVFGICLGHQILGLAMGGRTFKLKFGHRGSNHPVKDLTTGHIEITCQNHGFCVDMDSLSELDANITHINLNDGTVEGMEVPEHKAFGVQFHPESAPGPHDSRGLFDRFVKQVRDHGGTGG